MATCRPSRAAHSSQLTAHSCSQPKLHALLRPLSCSARSVVPLMPSTSSPRSCACTGGGAGSTGKAPLLGAGGARRWRGACRGAAGAVRPARRFQRRRSNPCHRQRHSVSRLTLPWKSAVTPVTTVTAATAEDGWGVQHDETSRHRHATARAASCFDGFDCFETWARAWADWRTRGVPRRVLVGGNDGAGKTTLVQTA